MALRVGIVGWRGMVGSVLLGRMREEGDFNLIEPVFFSTSQVGGNVVLEPATMFDLVGREDVTKPSLEVVYDTV